MRPSISSTSTSSTFRSVIRSATFAPPENRPVRLELYQKPLPVSRPAVLFSVKIRTGHIVAAIGTDQLATPRRKTRRAARAVIHNQRRLRIRVPHSPGVAWRASLPLSPMIRKRNRAGSSPVSQPVVYSTSSPLVKAKDLSLRCFAPRPVSRCSGTSEGYHACNRRAGTGVKCGRSEATMQAKSHVGVAAAIFFAVTFVPTLPANAQQRVSSAIARPIPVRARPVTSHVAPRAQAARRTAPLVRPAVHFNPADEFVSSG